MVIKIPQIKTYQKDQRMPMTKLYQAFLKLKRCGWQTTLIHQQPADAGRNRNIFLPILGFKTKKRGLALWLMSGIHGEEPAGPNALAKNIKFLNQLAKKIPLVILPLCNPSGYWRNWRYPGRKEMLTNLKLVKSVGEATHLLPDLKNPRQARIKKPACPEADAISDYVIKTIKTHQPLLVLDLHEDKSRRKFYLYSQGRLGAGDPVARAIVTILEKQGFKFYEQRKTTFGQKITNGIAANVNDDSVAELLGAERIIINKKVTPGPAAKSVITLETTSIGIPLRKRVAAHSLIIRQLPKFFEMIKKI